MLQKIKSILKNRPQETIGKFNLLLFGSLILIAIFSIGQLSARKIIKTGSFLNLPEYEITDSIFLDKHSSTSENLGTPLKPFKKINRALSFADKNPKVKNIYIKPGIYQPKITVPSNVNLYAYLPKTFILNKSLDDKTLTLKGNNIIQGLIIQGGRYAVYISKEAQKIQIKNCQIQDASWYGIYNQKHPEVSNEYKLEVANSEITGNYRQGLYLQKGVFVMKNSIVKENGEEGIDLHTSMNSTILDSEISHNGEGGIETELGDINLTVKNSLINNNGSSGINLQSDFENSTVKIENNVIKNNQDFGVRCALHSKISQPYFIKALGTHPSKNNTFAENSTAVDPNCWK